MSQTLMPLVPVDFVSVPMIRTLVIYCHMQELGHH